MQPNNTSCRQSEDRHWFPVYSVLHKVVYLINELKASTANFQQGSRGIACIQFADFTAKPYLAGAIWDPACLNLQDLEIE